MPRSRVLVELSHSRIAVSLLRGGRIAASRAALLEGVSPDSITSDPVVASVLRGLVAELDVAGQDTTVFYASPTAVTGVFNCARTAGRRSAARAARLALSESAGFSLDVNPSEVILLATDRTGAAGEVSCLHSLGVADREESTQSVVNLLRTAGLEAREVLPIEVPPIALTAQVALAGDEGVVVTLWVGPQTSVLAGASCGRLRFLRQIAIGSESLTSALLREIRPTRGDAATITLDGATARALLHASGIPARGEVFDPSRSIAAEAVLPLLQPVLQRWLVEIKQSLRFGFSEEERETAVLVGIGAGAAIPRLMGIIAEQCGLSCGEVEHQNCNGSIGCWMQVPRSELNLLPKAMVGQARQHRLARGLWIGAGAAALLIAADALLSRAALERSEAATASLRSRLESAMPAQRLKEQLLTVQSGLNAAQQRMQIQMSPHVQWDAALALFSMQTPPSVRLQEIRCTIVKGVPVCQVTGETPFQSSSAVLKEYLENLAAQPLVKSCRLGATSRGESSAGPVQHFDMKIEVLGWPPVARGAVAAVLPETSP